jgi:hypothetical protein
MVRLAKKMAKELCFLVHPETQELSLKVEVKLLFFPTISHQ